MPIDPISSVVSALLVVLEQHRDSVATLNAEPERHELSFLAVGAMRLDDFEWRGPVRELGLAWWRAFRRLEASFDATQWLHSFPFREVESLRAACEGTSRR
ncbi:MAG: hypothetical protein ACOZQL_21480 [Myxococcota bacterium]